MTFAVAIGKLMGVLPLLSSARHLTPLSIRRRQTGALLKIQDFQDIWKVSLIVFGLYLVLLGYLACRSGYVPRLLGVLLVIAGGGYLIDSITGLLSTSYTASVSSFTFIGEAR